MRSSLFSSSSAMLLHLLAFAFLGLPFVSQRQIAAASPLNPVEKSTTSSSELSAPLSIEGLSKRAVPSTDEIVAMIDKNDKVGLKPSVFWTAFYDYPGPKAYFTVRNWGIEKFGQRCNFYLYTDLLSSKNYESMKSRPQTEQEEYLQIRHLSKAYARRSKGTVYVLIPDGREPDKSSVWQVWEAPVLTRRPDAIDEIIRVSYPSGKEDSIWKKGDKALYDPVPPGKV